MKIFALLIKTISIFPIANLMGVFLQSKKKSPSLPYKITANSRSPRSKCQDAATKLQAILVKIVPKSPN
jgi:hypothetical protein